MSKYYTPQRTRNLYNPASTEPYRLSRSNIDLFLNCPRCFYLDRRLGVGRPPGYPFSLNSAVDELLKREFDIHRAARTKHPLMEAYGIDAVPLAHELMDEWRDALRKGIAFYHEHTNFRVTGGVDDVWVKPDGELLIVDYKATSKKDEVSLDAEWQIGYKRQMEVYQWLFRQNGFTVSNTGYFVYCNGDSDAEAFDGKLEFDIKVIPYEGNDSWVEKAIIDAHKCLNGVGLPTAGADCDYCKYRDAANSKINAASERTFSEDELLSFLETRRTISPSALQRRFQIGYAQAMRLIDHLEQAGHIFGIKPSGTYKIRTSQPSRNK